MARKYLIPGLAVVGFLVALLSVLYWARRRPPPPIEFPPPHPPYAHAIAGEGLIEANTKNISIGTPFGALAMEVYVQGGENLIAGDPLFKLDTRKLEADLKEAMAAKEVAFASFTRLFNEPRPESVPPVEAQVKQARANYENQRMQFSLYENVKDKRAISVDAYNQHLYSAEIALHQLEEAEANLALLNAGAWIEDLEISARQVDEAEARIVQVSTDIERATIRAPMDGQVLRVNVKPGEYAIGSSEDNLYRDPLILFGPISPLHIRVDVDEDDAWRFKEGMPAIAYVRGNSAITIPLEYVQTEPYILPKRSLTGSNTERVDTRVLQVIYRFEKGALPIYVGQLLDVYIQSSSGEGTWKN